MTSRSALTCSTIAFAAALRLTLLTIAIFSSFRAEAPILPSFFPYILFAPPNHGTLVAQDAVADSAVDGGFDRVSAVLGDPDEAEVAGEGGDDFFAVVARAFPHDGAEDFDEFVGLVVGHADGSSTDEVGTIRLDDPAADGGSQVAPERLVDLGAEALVAEDEGDFLEKLVSVEPSLTASGLAERCHDLVGLDLVDRRRTGRRFASRGWLNSVVGTGCFGRGAFSGGRRLFVCVVRRVRVVFVVAKLEARRARGRLGLSTPATRYGFRLALLVVEALLDFLGVPFVVELQEAGEDFTAGRFTDREPGALLGFVEAVPEVHVRPAVGGSDGVVHLDVEVTEFLDVTGRFVWIMEAVVGLGQPFLA